MPNYEKSSIYKLCCKNVEVKEIYIGSTTNFKRRKNAHKTICNNENSRSYNFNVYQYIRNHGGWYNWTMIEIKKVNCIDRRELCKIEREYIEKYNSKLNQALPYKTEEEKKTYYKNYDETNKERIKQRKKKYRETNKEAIKIRSHEYYKNNLDKIKPRSEKWREQNKERTKEYSYNHYERNKENMNKRRREKINCDCGAIICRDSIAKHNKTIKHKIFEESKIKNI